MNPPNNALQYLRPDTTSEKRGICGAETSGPEDSNANLGLRITQRSHPEPYVVGRQTGKSGAGPKLVVFSARFPGYGACDNITTSLCRASAGMSKRGASLFSQLRASMISSKLPSKLGY